MFTDHVVGIIGLVIGIVGTVITTWALIHAHRTNRENKQLRREKYRFSWDDVEKSAAYLARTCLDRNPPDAIVTFSGPGSLIANLAMILHRRLIPIYTILDIRIMPNEKPTTKGPPISLTGYTVFETRRRRLMFPETLRQQKFGRIAILDDCFITGEAVQIVLNQLLAIGYDRKQIVTGCAVVSKTVMESELRPDKYWECVTNDHYHFPWRERF